MPFGATLLDSGGTRFALWAPGLPEVTLELQADAAWRRLPMAALDHGWHRLDVAKARAGTRYRYVMPDGLQVPDPASRANPDDVHGASMVVDPRAYNWGDANWRGRPWHEAVIYELHVGTFTPEGSYAAAQARLPALAEFGITAVELMPVAEFPGRRNWGYDGVLPFAPESSYGTPDELKSLIDTAHRLGLMVLLDVVYNHFGPEGNYLHAYAGAFFNPAHQTPWGAAINFDGHENRTVRDFFIHNALYWAEEFHIDGLRLDAVHAIRDETETDIVTEIAHALRAGLGPDRPFHLVLENDANEARRLGRDAAGVPREASAQWNDDLHHAAHVLVSGETDGYYADYADEPLRAFGRALAEGFVYQGQASAFRQLDARGEASGHLPSSAFVSFLQTHDQVGNRAFGERLHSLAEPTLLRAAWACLLLSPHIPMFFMGDEFAASTPFLYFCEFGPELAAAVSAGRRAEFGAFEAFNTEAALAAIPDPNAAATFAASTLRWRERTESPHREVLADMGTLLALRHRHLVPRMAALQRGGVHSAADGVLRVSWPVSGGQWHLLANFGSGTADGLVAPAGEVVYRHGTQPAAVGVDLARGGVVVRFEPVSFEPG